MITTNSCKENKLQTSELLYPEHIEKETIRPAVKEEKETYVKNQARIVKNKKELSREIGLEIGAICGKHFLKLEHLHYGYWPQALKVDITNLGTAQENYTNLLISQIPAEVNTILDVGCGQGHTARNLLDRGFKVDGVSPSSFLAKRTRDLLGNNGSTVFETTFEELQTDKKYDLILFSESFQYIKPEDAITKALSLLNPGGFILISDIFKTDAVGKCLLSGGHPLKTFYEVVSKYPLEQISDLDITNETAPNIDIEDGLFREVVGPVSNLVDDLMVNRHPHILKILKWKFRKKIGKLNDKYLSGKRTGESFKRFKTYRILLYKTT